MPKFKTSERRRQYREKEKKQQQAQSLPEVKFDDIVFWMRSNPVLFIKKILGVDLWSKQREIAESVRDNPRTTVRSCSAGGKTMVAACIALWFIASFKPSTVLTTGRSARQVREQLWREIRARHAMANPPIGGNVTQTKIDLVPSGAERWFAEGFTTDNYERITGFHNENVLIIVDEASGISDEVYGAIENPLAAGFTRLLLLGNPTQNVGKFRESFESSIYKPFHISAFDTPSFTGEGNYPFLINKEYVEQAKTLYGGEDSPLYEVYIKGDFPSGEADRLIPFGLAEAATLREIEPPEDAEIVMGVDTGYSGEGENAVCVRKGNKVILLKAWHARNTEAIVGQIVRYIDLYKPQNVNIDRGFNPGVVDTLKAQNYHINGVWFGADAKDKKLYANAKAEMYWELSRLFKNGEIQIPDDKILLKQLSEIKPKDINRLGQMLLESKEEMKARGVKSPDRADALALCFMPLYGGSFYAWQEALNQMSKRQNG